MSVTKTILIIFIIMILFSCNNIYKSTVIAIPGDKENVTVCIEKPQCATIEQLKEYIKLKYPTAIQEYTNFLMDRTYLLIPSKDIDIENSK